MKILVTGGCGFIGSALVRQLLSSGGFEVVNVDKLTYAATPESLGELAASPRYSFEQHDICNQEVMAALFAKHHPEAVFHLAAESHVDRSIGGPAEFMRTNILGTYSLLEAARSYLDANEARRDGFRFIHVSTDEVFGDLELVDPPFEERTPYRPNSPYSASKASSDHLARAWNVTFGLPTITTNCSNNYGRWQAPEKLIPVVITSLVEGRPVPIYGDGKNIRDWLHVQDHVEALIRVLEAGKPGSRYNIGGGEEVTNLDLVKRICSIMDRHAPDGAPHESNITFVRDRLGHDRRYAINSDRMENELGWKAKRGLSEGIEDTVGWYLENTDWWRAALWRIQADRTGLERQRSLG